MSAIGGECLQEQQRHHDGDEDHGERGAEGPVAGGEELVVDQISHHLQPPTAQKIGGDEVPDGQDKNENRACGNAGQRQGQGDAQESGSGVGTQIAGGLGIGRIEPLQGGINGEHDEWAVVVDEAENDGELVVEHGQRLIDGSEPAQKAVDHALAIEQHHPGVGPDQVVGPEGQEHEKKECGLQRWFRAADGIGRGIGDQDRQHRGREGDACGVEKNGKIERIESAPEVLGRDDPVVDAAVDPPLEKGHGEDDRARQNHEQPEPEKPRQNEKKRAVF